MTSSESKFVIDTFASEIKDAMNAAASPPSSPSDDNSATKARQKAAAEYLQLTLKNISTQDILETLKGAIPKGASVGEMIVHSDDELTILYARVPPKFMSAVHNHTIFACIGTLIGKEENTIYSLDDGNESKPLKIKEQFVVQSGEVITLDADVIHSIANPDDTVLHSLHVYGGSFPKVMEERTLWTSAELKAMQFSFPGLMKESCVRMKMENNDRGLDAAAEAVPALKPMIDQIRS